MTVYTYYGNSDERIDGTSVLRVESGDVPIGHYGDFTAQEYAYLSQRHDLRRGIVSWRRRNFPWMRADPDVLQFVYNIGPPVMEIISRSKPVFDSGDSSGSDYVATNAVDADHYTLWHSIQVPNGGAPVWIAVDLRTIADANKTNCWWCMRNGTRPAYQPSPAVLGPDGSSSFYNLLRDAVLQGHASTGSLPAADDEGWTTLATITDNRRSDLVVTDLDLSGLNWFRVYVSATSGHTGTNEDVMFEFDLRDASQGTDNSIVVYGDSITFESWNIYAPGNARWPGGGMEDQLETALGQFPPVVMDAGSSSGNTIANTAAVMSDYIGSGPPSKYICIDIGSGDVGPEPFSGIDDAQLVTWRSNAQAVVDFLAGLDRTVIWPRCPYNSGNTVSQANSQLIAESIDQIVSANPSTVIPGPDFFTFFQTNPNLLRDGIHPTFDTGDPAGMLDGLTGYDWMHKMWVESLASIIYGISISDGGGGPGGDGGGPTAPGAPTSVHGTAGNGSVSLAWTAPASTGGASITGYRIIPFIAGVSQSAINTGSTSTSHTVTGLTNGTAYTFEVAATNSVGTGEDSTASSSITPTSGGGGGGEVTVVGSTVFDINDVASGDINKPSGVASGDLILIVNGSFSNAFTANVYTPPTGFTAVPSGVTSGALSALNIYSRIADGTEGSSFTISAAGADYTGVVCIVLRGVDNSTPIKAISAPLDEVSSFDNTQTSHVIPGASWSGAADVISLLIDSLTNNAGSPAISVTPPSGWSNTPPNGVNEPFGASVDISTNLTKQSGATSLPSETVTTSAAIGGQYVQLAIKVA